MKKLILFVCILSWSYNTNAQCDSTLPVSENFSNVSTINTCWDFIDYDGDGHNWYVASLSGNNGLVSESYTDALGYLTPDNWAITQMIDLTSYSSSSSIVLTWKVRARDWSFDQERYSVYVATGNQISNFTASPVTKFENLDNTDASGFWGNRSLDISSLAGNRVYIAFRHYASVFQDQINIDDVQVSSGSSGGGGTGGGSGCTEQTANFTSNTLTLARTTSKSTTLSIPSDSQNINFTINGIDEKTKGREYGKYIDRVLVTYKDASGNSHTYGTYSGDQVSSATISIPGPAQSIVVTLDDAYDGTPSTSMSIDLGPVTYCSATASQTPSCIQNSANFKTSTLTQTGTGSNSTIVNLLTNGQDATFTISGMDERLKGNPGSQYIEHVKVTYVDGLGSTKTFNNYTGSTTSSVDVTISGLVKSITVTLDDQLNGGTSSTMSVDLSTVSYCVSSTARISNLEQTANIISEYNQMSVPELTYKIYPNPASHVLFIKNTQLLEENQANIYLYNLQGTQVRTMNSNSGQTQEMNIDGLATGLYLLRIINQKGETLKTERIVIK